MHSHDEAAEGISLGKLHATAMLDCTIRDSDKSDIARVQRIYAFHVLHGLASFEEQPPAMDELNRRRAEVLGRGLPYVVADMNGEVVGYSYAAPYRSRPAYRFTVENSVYVDHRLTGRGVGNHLLSALIGRCVDAGCRQMVAVIGDSANAASIALHSRHGFRHVGTLHSVGFKFGRWVDSVLMQRALAADLTSDVPAGYSAAAPGAAAKPQPHE